MQGMSRIDGTLLSPDDHLAQSIEDILTTLVGTRICRREYGSLVMELIDQPCSMGTRLQVIAATATALIRWEPRIKITRVSITADTTIGNFWSVLIDGTSTDTDAAISVPVQFGAAA